MPVHHVIFRGHVQGVGFRWKTARVAKYLPVRGFVRNLPDGSVELVADCSEETLQTLLDQLKSHFGNGITQAEVSISEVAEDYDDFQIRR